MDVATWNKEEIIEGPTSSSWSRFDLRWF